MATELVSDKILSTFEKKVAKMPLMKEISKDLLGLLRKEKHSENDIVEVLKREKK